MQRSADKAVEVTAEAMRAAYGKHTNDDIVPWASAGLPQKAAWRVCAQAAIAAIRRYHFDEAAGIADAAIKDAALTNCDKSPGSLAAIAYHAIRAAK